MIYIGACEVYLTNSSGQCVYPLGKTAEPADKTKILKFFRAVVLITWPDNSCPTTTGNPANTCSYITSTLVSRAPEPQFDLKRPAPTVLTSAVTFYVGTPVVTQLEARGGQLPKHVDRGQAAGRSDHDHRRADHRDADHGRPHRDDDDRHRQAQPLGHRTDHLHRDPGADRDDARQHRQPYRPRWSA